MILDSSWLIAAGIGIGLVTFTILYIGKGLQKLAIEGIKAKKSVKNKHSGVWIAGTLLTALHMFIHWVALLYAPVNVVAPLEGAGLVVLLVFCYVVLKERITRVELVGVALIIASIFLITSFNVNPALVDPGLVNLPLFFLLLPVLLGAGVAGILVSRARGYKHAGVVLGLVSGTLMAFQTVAKRVTSVPDALLGVSFSVLVLLFALFTMVTSQLAFAKGDANRVQPCFTSMSIFLATVLGGVTLGEIILLPQYIGLALALAGVFLITVIDKEVTVAAFTAAGGEPRGPGPSAPGTAAVQPTNDKERTSNREE